MNQSMDSPRRHRLFRPGLTAVTLAVIVTGFLFLLDQLSAHFGLKEPLRVFDDIFGGTIAGLLIYRYESKRSKYLSDRLKMIELMNHHVRNALNVIIASIYAHGHEKELNEIASSVDRIEWALREILPGRVLNEYSEAAAEKSPPPRSTA